MTERATCRTCLSHHAALTRRHPELGFIWSNCCGWMRCAWDGLLLCGSQPSSRARFPSSRVFLARLALAHVR